MRLSLPPRLFAVVCACTLLLGSAILSACAPEGREPNGGGLVTPTRSTAETTTALPEPTPIEPFTATPAPSESPAATAVPPADYSPAPGGELSGAGPWLVYQAENRLWATSSDGSGRTALIEGPLDLTRELVASPPGSPPRLAMVVSHAGYPGYDDLTLRVLRLPEGEVEAEIDLLAYSGPPGSEADIDQGRMAAALNVGMDWSPSGRYLAFAGQIDGPSADLYRYDGQTGEIRRMSDEPQQVGALSWSPDEEWIVYQTVENFGTGAGWEATGVWAVPAGGGPARQLLAGRQQVYAGWTAQGELITCPWGFGNFEPAAADNTVQAIHPESGRARVLFSPEEVEPGDFVAVAFMPAGEEQVAVAVASQSGEDRLVLVPAGGGPARVVLTLRASDLPDLAWSGELERLLVAWGDEVLQVTPEGEIEVRYPERGLPVVSPDGEFLAFTSFDKAADPGLRLYRPNGERTLTLTERPTTSLLWQPQGRYVFYVAGERLLAARLPDGETRLVQEPMPEFDFTHSMTWVGVQ